MLDALSDPWSGEIGQRALAEVLILAFACGPLGVWVVLFRQSYAAESIAHAALPGLVLATLAGVPLLLGAAGGLLGAAAVIALAGRDERIGPDVAVSVAVTTLFGAGVLLALQPDVPARLGEVLFGDPLSVTDTEILVTGLLALSVGVCLGAFHRRLVLAGFDPGTARSLGVGVGGSRFVLLGLLAAATLVAVGALGNLLVVALLVAPGAAALQLTRRLVPALLISVLVAALSGVAGLYASYHLEVAAGASIALAAVAAFALALAVAAAPPRHSPVT